MNHTTQNYIIKYQYSAFNLYEFDITQKGSMRGTKAERSL